MLNEAHATKNPDLVCYIDYNLKKKMDEIRENHYITWHTCEVIKYNLYVKWSELCQNVSPTSI